MSFLKDLTLPRSRKLDYLDFVNFMNNFQETYTLII